MAAVVLWKHKKRQKGKMEAKHVRGWLKVVASLVVVMGVTWIVGVLIVEVEALLPLAYIYTIMVAFQGVWIFLFFVVFPKEVREDMAKLWKTKVVTSHLFSAQTVSYYPQRACARGYSSRCCLCVCHLLTLRRQHRFDV